MYLNAVHLLHQLLQTDILPHHDRIPTVRTLVRCIIRQLQSSRILSLIPLANHHHRRTLVHQFDSEFILLVQWPLIHGDLQDHFPLRLRCKHRLLFNAPAVRARRIRLQTDHGEEVLQSIVPEVIGDLSKAQQILQGVLDQQSRSDAPEREKSIN